MDVTEECTDLSSLQRWQALSDAVRVPHDSDDNQCVAPFPCDPQLNARVALWHGAIWTINAAAIVNSTCESLQDTSGLCRKIIDAAGKEYWTECASAGACRTGEAVVTRGCRLAASKIIHTVSPRYNPKYHNAAEHALHMCYRSVLSAAVEHKLRSVVFPCVYTKRKAYPRDEAAHIALRTVRRFLEHYRDELDVVVFCVDTLEDQLIYEALLPLYFPRSLEEQQRSGEMLANRELGDDYGEPIIDERKIRIGESVGSHDINNNNDPEDDEDTAVQGFCEMTEDPDAERLERLQQRQQQRQRQLEQCGGHTISNQATRQQSFDDLHKLRFLYNAGVDHAGAPVFVYMASQLRASDVDLDHVMLYIIQTLDAVVDKRFSVLYVHTNATDESTVAAAWLKRLFQILSTKYQHSLAFFYVYEPSVWLKLLVLVAKGFVSAAFYKKIVYLSSPKDIGNVAAHLDLPHHIWPRNEPKPSDKNNSSSSSSETEHSVYSVGASLFARKSAAIM